jgi:hypothetical protein
MNDKMDFVGTAAIRGTASSPRAQEYANSVKWLTELARSQAARYRP